MFPLYLAYLLRVQPHTTELARVLAIGSEVLIGLMSGCSCLIYLLSGDSMMDNRIAVGWVSVSFGTGMIGLNILCTFKRAEAHKVKQSSKKMINNIKRNIHFDKPRDV